MPPAETQALARVAGRTEPNPCPGPPDERFHQLLHVVSTRSGDATVLMDRKRGTYHTLNEVGGRVWELLGGGGTISAVIERLLEEYDVPRQQLEGDVAATIRQFLAKHLVGPGPMPTSAAPADRLPKPAPQVVAGSGVLLAPSVLRCGVTLLVLKTLLKAWGYSRTIGWIRRWVEGVPVRGEVDVVGVKTTEYRVAMAGALYPGRARCLEQSLTLYCLLRRQGIPVKYRQGVQPYPFQAHAWIEYRDEVINDVPEHATQFSRLPDQLP